MFRERPLTWLFILATVVVDLAMFFGGRVPVFEGIVVGQVAAIAIWAAIGQSHRLTRGSLLVVAIGILAYLPGFRSFQSYSRILTFMAAFALAVVATSLVFIWLRRRIRIRFDSDHEQTPLKVPLIEFFGWTIVVAIASFGARHMDVQFLERVQHFFPVYLLTYAIVPLALVLFNSRFRMLHLLKAVLLVYGAYWMGTHFLGRGSWYGLKMASLTMYLTAWLLVRSIEYDQPKAVEETAETEEPNGDIKLFDADE